MTTDELIKEEDRKIRYLRRMVDFTLLLIMESDMTLEDATRHAAAMRVFALRLFPDKGGVFDLVYGQRIRRLITSKYRLS